MYQQLDPAVREKFENLGLMYVRNFSDGLDVSWQRFFHTEDRAVVEEACRKAGLHRRVVWKRQPSGEAEVAAACFGIRSRERFHSSIRCNCTMCTVWIPRCASRCFRSSKREDLPRHVYYGDGSPIEDSVMDHIGEIYEKNAVRFQWREGDMVTLDNMITAHARDPFVGPRKIVVALGDLVHGADLDRASAASNVRGSVPHRTVWAITYA